MGKYKVLKEFVLNGSTLKADSIVELRGVHEKLKSIKDNVEKVPNETPLTVGTAAEVSVLGGIVPGTPLTPEQKDKIDAQKLAAEKARRAREFQENLKAAINLSRLRQIREVVDNAEKK